MSEWLGEAVAVVERIRGFFPTLDGLHGSPYGPDGQAQRRGKLASTTLPFDPRPTDLYRDVRRFAARYSPLAHGAMRAGVDKCPSTVERLAFIAGALPTLDQAEPELVHELMDTGFMADDVRVFPARQLDRRYTMIVDPPEPVPGYSLEMPCTECSGELWVSTSDYHVQCLRCGVVWPFADIERAALAVRE